MAPTRRGYTLWHVVATLPWIVAVLVARSAIDDNSFLWHVTAGRLQADAGAVLTVDPFSLITAGQPWRTQSWLADVGYAWFDDQFGLDFVPWFRFTGAVVLFLVVASIARSVTSNIAAIASVSFLTALLSVPYLNPRPVLFSYVLLATLVLVERHARLRWTLPVLFFLWASLHGSWVIGAGYLVLSVLHHKEYRRIVEEAPWIFMACLVTAHGWAVFDYLLAFGRSGDALSLISEWAPPDLLSVARLPFTIAILVLLLGAAKGALTVRQATFAIPIVLFGLSSSRSVLPAFLMLIPAVTTALDVILAERLQRRLAGVRWIVAGIFVLPLVLPVSGGVDTNRFPVELIERARGQRLFHDDVVGGYLIYAEWPGTPVLVDDRAELYGDELERFVSARSGAAGWQDYFERFDFTAAILGSEQALVQLLETEGWVRVATDGEADQWVLMERA